MASKPKTQSASSETRITRADLKAGISPVPGKLTGDAFDLLDGDIYAGKNVIKLAIDEAGGPFVMVKKVVGGFTPKPSKKDPNPDPIDTFEANALGSRRPVHMPLSTSFVEKANDAGLSEGDIFAIRRAKDYSAHGRHDCKSFELKVLARAGSDAESFVKKYLTATQ